MEPSFKEGNIVFVSTLGAIKVGDVIVFQDQKKKIIKRVVEEQGKDFLVAGDNKDDSLAFGKVEKEKVVGRVLFKF